MENSCRSRWRNNLAKPNTRQHRHRDIARTDLRTPEVAGAASEVAVIPEVRAAMVAFQKDFAHRPGGAVLDGRDIGSVICPEAEAKLFITANDRARAHRRWLELNASGHKITEAEVLANVRERDARDAGRAASPMVVAPDAVTIDTSDMDIDEAVKAALDVVRSAWEGKP